MEIIYHSIFGDIQDHIIKAELNNRRVKKIILTPREFGELQKEFMVYRTDAHNYTILGIPFEVA